MQESNIPRDAFFVSRINERQLSGNKESDINRKTSEEFLSDLELSQGSLREKV